MRSYSVATTSLALGVAPKWVDNLLSQHRVEGVKQSAQGVQRRLSPRSLLVIATVHLLTRELRVPVAAALRLAHDLWGDGSAPESPDAATLKFGELTLHLDHREISSRVESRLAEALEIAPRTRRGRPPKNLRRAVSG